MVLCGLAILVGSTCLRSYQPYTFLFRDGSFYAQTNRSIAAGLTLRQEDFQPRSWYDGSLPWYRNLDDAWSNVSVGTRGEWYPKHSYLMPLFSTPFFVLLGEDGLLLFNALAMVVALFSGYRLARRWSGPQAAAVAVFLVAGSPLVPYLSYAYSHDVFYAALVAGGAQALASARPAWAGTLFGLSIVAKVTNCLVVVPIALALTPWHRRSVGRLLFFMAIPVSAFAIANWAMYGSPLTTSYHRILTVRDGRPLLVSYENAFSTPLAHGLRRFFSDSPEGEVGRMASLPLLAYLGLLVLARRARAVAVALGASLVLFFVVFAKYQYGGARFFMPWLVLSPVPGAALLEAMARALEIARDRTWTRWSARTRRRVAGVCALVAMGAIAGSWWTGRPGPTGSLARDVERLEVRLDDIPCDYFNMTHQKWECSGLDRGGRYCAGLAIGQECAGMEPPVLYVPSDPRGRTRVVRWTPTVEGSRLRVVWKWQAAPARENAHWTLRVGEGPPTPMKSRKPDSVIQAEVAGPVGPGLPVTLALPGDIGEAVLCVAATVEE